MNGTLHVSPYETLGEAEYRQINRHPLLSQRLAVVHLHDGIQTVDGQYEPIPANLSRSEFAANILNASLLGLTAVLCAIV